MTHQILDGFLGGYVLVDAIRHFRARYRAWQAKRAIPSLMWWYKWLSTWGFIGLTEAIRVRAEPPDITVDHEALDAIAAAATIPSVTRRTSSTYSPETPVWNPHWQRWEESDLQLRMRIRGN